MFRACVCSALRCSQHGTEFPVVKSVHTNLLKPYSSFKRFRIKLNVRYLYWYCWLLLSFCRCYVRGNVSVFKQLITHMARARAHTHAHTHTHTHTHTHARARAHEHTHARKHTHTRSQTQLHTDIHHTHTQTHARALTQTHTCSLFLSLTLSLSL